MVIQEQDRQEWAHGAVTQEFLQTLRESKQEAMEVWASEGFVGKTIEETAIQTAAALGGMRVLVELIDKIEALTKVEEVA